MRKRFYVSASGYVEADVDFNGLTELPEAIQAIQEAELKLGLAIRATRISPDGKFTRFEATNETQRTCETYCRCCDTVNYNKVEELLEKARQLGWD